MPPGASTVTLASGVTLSYAAKGDATDAAVVLLPGPTDSWVSYSQVWEWLPPSLYAVAVSLRGHGDSDKPASGYGVEDFAGDVMEFLDVLGIERAVVGGHSGSCLVARRVALQRPECVAGLILEASPTTLRGHPRLVSFVESDVAELTDPIGDDFAHSFVTDTSSAELAPSFVAELADEVTKVPARVWREMFAALLVYDDSSELARISAPALLVWGDTDDLVDREMQTALLDQIPLAELRVYEGVGHTPRWEQPERFATDVAAFSEHAHGLSA